MMHAACIFLASWWRSTLVLLPPRSSG